jgi:flagellar biosynthetic protein FliR
MGLNLGPALSPMMDAEVSGVGELKNLLALALYLSLGGHLVLLTGVARSFEVIPPGSVLDFAQGGRTIVALGASVFSTAVRAVAPLMVALLLANFGFAILSRAVPQLNAMAVAFPVTIGIGLLMLGAALPYTGSFVGQWVAGLDDTVGNVVQGFARPVGY